MDEFYNVASIILLNREGKFILQKRDDKPGIRNPGMLSVWGGAVEGDEKPVEAAVREVREETNLQPEGGDVHYLREYRRDYKVGDKQVVNHVFIIKDVDERTLEVYEGQGYQVVDPKTQTTDPLYTKLTAELIKEYSLAKSLD